jgi:hypothetical protein
LIGSPLLFVHVGLLTVGAFGSKPLASIDDALIIGRGHTESSLSTEMLVTLRGPKGHTLKADRAMLN